MHVHVFAHERTVRRGVEFFAPVFGIVLFRPFGFKGIQVLDCTDFKYVIVGRVTVLCGLLYALQEEQTEAVGDTVFMEIVVGIYETVGAVFVGIKAAPNVFGDEFDCFAHEFVVVDVAFVVYVVNYDIIGAVFAFARTTGRLTEAQ